MTKMANLYKNTYFGDLVTFTINNKFYIDAWQIAKSMNCKKITETINECCSDIVKMRIGEHKTPSTLSL